MSQQPLSVEQKEQAPSFPWPPVSGFYWELLRKRETGKPYTCGLCGLLARNAVDLTCPEHSNEEDDDDSDDENNPSFNVYCETCLKHYIESNEGNCPLKHPNPKWQLNVGVVKFIGKLTIACPRALQESIKAT